MSMGGIPQTFYERALMLDSSPLISLYSLGDHRASEARKLLWKYQKLKYPICVTQLTISEVQRRLMFDEGRVQGIVFLKDILDGSVNIFDVKLQDAIEAVILLEKFDDQDISYTDAISMVIMKRFGIFKVFTYDFHFSLLGFETISV